MSNATTKRITVYVNDEPHRVFLGLRVRHAIGHQAAWDVERRQALVEDREGNQLDLDRALYNGQRMYVKDVL
jgi:hypothetical protein